MVPDLDALLRGIVGVADSGPKWRLVCSFTDPIDGGISVQGLV
jgi:hypothetical protein